MPLVFGNPTYAAPDKKWQEVRVSRKQCTFDFFVDVQPIVKRWFNVSGPQEPPMKRISIELFFSIINHQPLLPILDLVDIELTITNLDYPNGYT